MIKQMLDDVLERVTMGPAVFMLFARDSTLAHAKKIGDMPKALIASAIRNECHRNEMEDIAKEAGGCFAFVPLPGFDSFESLGAVYTEQQLTSTEMYEQLLELRGMVKLAANSDDERHRYKLLFEVTKTFHAAMDVNGVLREIVRSFTELYPAFRCRLLLSHDGEYDGDLPIDIMTYGKDDNNVLATNAYLTGTIRFDSRSLLSYVPLKGKQGVYGVLEITAPPSFTFSEEEAEWLQVLADTGGEALENAILYQQSQRLIADLQIVNHTSHRLNANLRLSDAILFMTEQISRSFQSDEVGFVLFRPVDAFLVLEGSTEYFFEKESERLIRFAGDRLKADMEALFVGDLHKEPLHPHASFRSFMGVPMIQNGELYGMVAVLHAKPYQFSFDEFKLLQSLVHHSTLAFTNALLHEELEKLVITDYLTGLYTRHYLDQQIGKSMQKDGWGCFILLDIDDFKHINDVYGHQVGDEVLVQVAEILQNNCRERDIAARWGGEELAVYLPKVDRASGSKIARRLIRKIGEGTSPRVTASCGISFWGKENEDQTVQGLFNRADQALYSAKGAGKNQVTIL